MAKTSDLLRCVDTMISEAAAQGLLQLSVEDHALEGCSVTLAGRRVESFGSCSYLALEQDERLRQGVIEAVMRYGTQFSSSRTYMSAPAYEELESLLGQLFGRPVLVTPSTSLGHLAALPVLIGEKDAVLVDQQAHHSLQVALNQVRLQGATVELVRHNRLDLLEARLKELQGRHPRVWYVADGVYSMYGDLAPIEALGELMERFSCLHLYVDDAHGMSWAGRHGRGTVLDRLPHAERLYMATSLNKAFAAAGGAIVLPDAESLRRVRTCGGPMIFSGPVQPPMLGAAIASARLHLSPEITRLQDELRAIIREFNGAAAALGLPLLSTGETPVRFIGVGTPGAAFKLARRVLDEGCYVNVSMFPAVPMKRAGLRVALTRHHSPEAVRRVVEAIAHHLPEVLAEEGRDIGRVRALFDLPEPMQSAPGLNVGAMELNVAAGLRLEHQTSIADVGAEEWDRLLGDRGAFGHAGLRFLEDTFGQAEAENRWRFHYYIVRDADGAPVLATFFTEALWKDDMLAPAEVSRLVEAQRRKDPSFLTSRVFAMGSLLTEGEHLFLDRGRDWRAAMALLLSAVEQERERSGADALVLRDMTADAELEAWLRDEGFVQQPMPESMVLALDGRDETAHYEALSKPSRRHHRRDVWPWNDAYQVEVVSGRTLEPALADRCDALYAMVKARSLELNTFALPPGLFARMAENAAWELLLLRPAADPQGPPVGVVACYVGAEHYAPVVVGLDDAWITAKGLYRQALRQVMLRAMALGKRRVDYGMGAAFEKRRFGARSHARFAYFQASDLFNQEVLAQLAADAHRH